MCDPSRWGLPPEAVAQLGDRLGRFWSGFQPCFKTRTRDTSDRAYDYLRGQLTIDTRRNFANMAPTFNGAAGQTLQHFLSNSPCSSQAVFRQIQTEIKTSSLPPRGTP